MAAIAIGDKLDGKYVVVRRLGGGGFGEVFLANDEEIAHRQVAIKVLRQSPNGDHSNLRSEMQALAKFNHPHVVAFYHHFADGERLYLVMEFCSAGSLDDRLRAGGSCAVEQVFAWGVELCDTLAFVHGNAIVHHDIKPQNILFAADGTIKLGDFGVANLYAGTCLYMPPEMLLGKPVSRTDPRADVYALGLTLLEAVTGRNPFKALPRDQAIHAAVAHDFIPTDLPRWVQEVLLKATHPTPELRFQSAHDFGAAIRSRHVSHVFDRNRIKADALAKRAEEAIARRKWKRAESLANYAMELSPDCVAALLAAGRCHLLIRHLDRASEYFARAVAINPRVQVQKELGWKNLEEGQLPLAISLLTDHLQRDASDFEAYNLLLKCFYLTDRFEAGESLALTVMNEKPQNDCFRSNRLLCQMLDGSWRTEDLEDLSTRNAMNPFVVYNVAVVTEEPSAWGRTEGSPGLKSKLLFEEFRFGTAAKAARRNTLAIYTPDGSRHDLATPIVTIGSLAANSIVVRDRSVSRRHCAIVNYPDDVWLYDLGSAVGTMVDGKPVAGGVFLEGVHNVTIGGVKMRVAARSDLLV